MSAVPGYESWRLPPHWRPDRSEADSRGNRTGLSVPINDPSHKPVKRGLPCPLSPIEKAPMIQSDPQQNRALEGRRSQIGRT